MHRDHIRCFRGNLDLLLCRQAARRCPSIPIDVIVPPLPEPSPALQSGIDSRRSRIWRLLDLIGAARNVLEVIVWLLPAVVLLAGSFFGSFGDRKLAIFMALVNFVCVLTAMISQVEKE